MLLKIAACTKNGSAFSLQLFHLCFSSPSGQRGAEAPKEQPCTALPPRKVHLPFPGSSPDAPSSASACASREDRNAGKKEKPL